MWFDSHCHLKIFSDREDLENIISRATDSQVLKMITVGTSPKDWKLYANLVEKYGEKIEYTVGLHPCYVSSSWEKELRILSDYWGMNRVPVALGEIGLDFFRLPKDKRLASEVVDFQIEAFRKQLEIASVKKIPVIIHSRNAFSDCVNMIDESDVDWNNVVFHCFSESTQEIMEINQRGGWVSFTGILTYKSNEHLREALRATDIDRLMLETDSPYLSPIPKRGKENEPSFLPYLGSVAAETLGLNEQKFATQIFENSSKFYDCHLNTKH
tara:strand:- start:103 stop:912 length:810 start_codon:yes stop_codon:yes gene_type:complete